MLHRDYARLSNFLATCNFLYLSSAITTVVIGMFGMIGTDLRRRTKCYIKQERVGLACALQSFTI